MHAQTDSTSTNQLMHSLSIFELFSMIALTLPGLVHMLSV